MSWISLYVKELRLTKFKFILAITFLLMVAILFFVLIEKYDPLFITLTIPLILLHFFYMFFAMLDSLRQEWRQNTVVFWMNIPKSGWQLITAKFVAVMTQLFTLLTITFLMTYVLLQRFVIHFADPTFPNFLIQQFEAYWWLLFIGIFIASLQTGVASTFIFMVAKSFRKWGWLLGGGITVAFIWLWGKILETDLYRMLTEWGVVLEGEAIMNTLTVNFNKISTNPTIDKEVTNGATLYVGTAIGDLLLVAVVLYICAWLLDKKVEA